MKSLLYSRVVLAVFTVFTIFNFGFGKAQLSLESAEEGPCLDPPAQRSFLAWTFIFAHPTPWYVPMAHSYFYQKYANTLLDRTVGNETELAEMNLQLNCLASTCVSTGFQNASVPVILLFAQTCVPTVIDLLNPGLVASLTCGTIPSTFGSLNAVVIWTDSSSALLLGLCINGQRAHAVLSNSPQLNSATEATIRNELISNGYDSSYIQELPNWPVSLLG